MLLRVEQLESRSLLSGAPVIDLAVIGRPDLAEWGVPVHMMFADVTGPEEVEGVPGGVKVLDTVFFAGTGGGARVRIEDGGRAYPEPVFDPWTGGTVLQNIDYGDVLFDGFVFDGDFRGGLVGESTWGPDRDTLHFAWGEQPDGLMPGPQLARATFFNGVLTVDEILAMEAEYRGGLALAKTHYGPPEQGSPGGDDLLVLPATGGGGGPRMQGYEGATGAKLFDFFAGNPGLRNTGDTQFRLSPALSWVLSPFSSDIAAGPYGFALDRGDGTNWPEVRFYTDHGQYVARLDLEAVPFVGWVEPGPGDDLLVLPGDVTPLPVGDAA